jgi:hypothetical protein
MSSGGDDDDRGNGDDHGQGDDHDGDQGGND